MDRDNLKKLKEFLAIVPGIKPSMGEGISEDGTWWIKFQIDITHPLAWQVVQEIGYVANYLSINEKLSTIFYPVSPPPYLNGAAKDYLSWVIESTDKDFSADIFTEWLEGRMPRPVDDLSQWTNKEE